MPQIHKKFTDEQVKRFLDCYLHKKIQRQYIQEILNIADRVLVMTRGKIVAEVHPEHATKQTIMEYCLTAQ